LGYPDLPVFLGVGRFKGYWNANTNSGTLATAPVGGYEAFDTTPLFSTGSTDLRNPNALGGYDGGTNLTATLGDFWKVTTAGSTSVDDEDSWRISDFVVFTYNSGSTSGSVWQKLNYVDTISSVIVGNGSGGSTKFGLVSTDVHEFTGSVYVSGALYAEELNTTVHNQTIVTSIIEKSGSTTLGNSNDDTHTFTGTIIANDPASFLDDLDVSGSLVAHQGLRISGSNGDYTWAVGGRQLRLLDTNDSTYPFITQDGLTGIGSITPTHTLTVSGDISGSGKILNVGGIETQGYLGVTGSATILGAASIGGTTTITADLSSSGKILNVGGIETQGSVGVTGSMTVRNMLTHVGDLSGSGKIFNVGGIETQGNLGVTGSMTVRNMLTHVGDLSGSGKIFNLGGFETAGNLGVSGSTTLGSANNDTHAFNGTIIANDHVSLVDNLNVSGTISAEGGGATIALRFTSSAGNTDYKVYQAARQLSIHNANAGGFAFSILDQKVSIAGQTPSHPLTVYGDISGSGKILNVAGIETQGYLGVTGSVTVLGTTTLKNTLPATDNSFDLGSAAKRWANVYTGDLHLRNDRGDWTIVEEEDYLCVVNNKNNKRYKMMLEEIKD
jgi:hypothetical protein